MVQAATTVNAAETLYARCSNQQAMLKTDSSSTGIGDPSAYLTCGYFEDPQIQTSLATIVIGKNIYEPDAATTHRNQ
jgi:hypothetical protein